jgi:hypothetical protein
LRAHSTHISQPDSGQTSTTEQVVIWEPTPTTAMQSNSSLPSSNFLKYPTGQQPHTYGTSHSRKVHPPGQFASSSTQSSQGTLRQWHHPRSMTPVTHQGSSGSHSVLQTGEGPGSVNFATLTFSFWVPSQTSHLVPVVSQNHPSLHPMATEHPSYSHDSTAFTQPSTQISTQMSVVPPQPSMWHSIVSIGTVFTSTQGDQL